MVVGTAVLGFPRIGPDRELKFALERFWRGETDELEGVDAQAAAGHRDRRASGARGVREQAAAGGRQPRRFPYKESGTEMARLALHPNVTGAMDVATRYRLDEIAVTPGCAGAGQAVGDVRGGSLIVAVRRANGSFHPQPAAETVLREGDVVMAIGPPQTLTRLERRVRRRRGRRPGRRTAGARAAPAAQLSGSAHADICSPNQASARR